MVAMATVFGLRALKAPLVACLLAASLLFFVAPPAWALDSSSRAAARQLGYEGVEAYQAEDYAHALDKLERAYRVLQVPSLALWSARALEKSGKWVEASERYLEATRLPVDQAGDAAVQERAKADAKAERATLLTKIPKVIVLIEGAESDQVEVTIDGVAVNSALFGAGRPTNPGQIEVVARLGERTVKGQVQVAEGEQKSITLAFQQAPPSPAPVAVGPVAPQPPAQTKANVRASNKSQRRASSSGTKANAGGWQPIAGYSALGVGAAGLVFGGITGVLALIKDNQLRDECGPDRNCPQTGYDSKVKTQNALRMMSGAGLIAGGVLTAAGVTLLLVPNKPGKTQDRAQRTPLLGVRLTDVRLAGGSSLTLRGTF